MLVNYVCYICVIFFLTPLTLCTKWPSHNTTESYTTSDYDRLVIVDPGNETAVDSERCYPSNGSIITCKTLDYAFQQLEYHRFGSHMFYLASPNSNYVLSRVQSITSTYNIGIFGNDTLCPHIPTIKCGDGAGLLFKNSSNIVINSIRFVECGANHTSTSKDYSLSKMYFITIRSTLYFYNCTNVEMFRVEVLNSSRATGVTMYDIDGIVKVRSCTFVNNSVYSNGSHAGGGGFSVEFTYCKPGDTTCDDDKYDPDYKRNKNSCYLFINCTFEGNIASNLRSNHYYVIPIKSNHDATGRGGGLSIFLKGDAFNNSISVVRSHFIRNRAVWGGGLRIQMSDDAYNNLVSVSRCTITENHTFQIKNKTYTGGGGIDVITTVHNSKDIKSMSKIDVNGCIFKYNNAMEGGAIKFEMARQNISDFKELMKISMSNSSFEYNQARLGSAVLVDDFPVFSYGLLPAVEFYNCNFSGNRIRNVSTPVHEAGIGTVFINNVLTMFHNYVEFFNNTGSALVVAGTLVNFTGTTALFNNNSGINGGAIALLGVSSILIGLNTDMTFVNNYALLHGGAIFNRYIGNEFLESNANCFLHYSEPVLDPREWEVRFNFSGNTAGKDGCSIFSTSAYPCNAKWGNDEVDVFQWNKTNWYYENKKCTNEVLFYTEAQNFTFSNNRSLSDPDTVVSFIPGHHFTLPLQAWDEFNNNVTESTVYSALVLNGSDVADIEPGFTYITSNYIKLTGKPGNNITLELQTAGARSLHVEIKMTILECPPGFVPISRDSPKSTTCECPGESEDYRNLLRCIAKHFLSRIHFHYWYGPVNTNTHGGSKNMSTLMGSTPFAYRSKDANLVVDDLFIDLPRTIDEVDHKLCGGANRTGVLCGECLDGYAVAVNSPSYECVPCNISNTKREFVGHLFAYVALTYIPIAIIFLVIIFFNIKLASSAAAGFLLYAQTVSSGYFNVTGYTLSYLASKNKTASNVQMTFKTIYGIFNLESFATFLPPFCLNERFNTLHVLCLDYFIAAFPLIVIAMIFLAYRCKSVKCYCPAVKRNEGHLTDSESVNQKPSRWKTLKIKQNKRWIKAPKNTLIHALMAFMLLSYAKFSLASIKTLVNNELFNSTGHTITRRIYLAGHLSFNDHQFLFPFGILAILVLIFIVLLPPLFLLGPLKFIDSLADKAAFKCICRYWPTITIHTFLDTVQGYKSNRRFFAGLYLLFRLYMFLTFAFSQDVLTQFVLRQAVIIIFAVLVPLLRPYTNELLNYSDTLLFVNLGILNAISVYTSERQFSVPIYTFQCFLVFLPLVCLICYLVWNQIRKNKYYHVIKNSIIDLALRIRLYPVRAPNSSVDYPEGRERLIPINEVEDYPINDPDEQIFQRAEGRNNYQTANIHTVPPRRCGDVPKTEISLPELQLSKTEEANVDNKMQENDSGIERQTNSGEVELDSRC